MPGVLKYTPPWLARPSSGFDLFSAPPSKVLPERKDVTGPKRTIARRGTEVFIAVGNELRWSDLVFLRDNWDAHHRPGLRKSSNSIIDQRANETSYRILKVPISQKIRQLIISPKGDHLAILTSHTVHVAILPDSTHLTSEDTSPLKLRTLQVGPTAHVLEQSPIATALWHSLGLKGMCLVTITVDAIVRTWELDTKTIRSFDLPTSAIDLRKLANGAISSDDFSPAKFGTSKGFSPDSFEMEVASACLGSVDQEGNNVWSSMTLWVAMREGDIYALCPFLPTKFTGISSLLPALSASIACEFLSTKGDDSSAGPSHGSKANDRTLWISDLMNQSNANVPGKGASAVLQRPARPSPVPLLQGPFHVASDADQLFDTTDIRIITTTTNNPSDYDDGNSTNSEADPSVELLCIATSDGKVHLCVDIDGVEGRWLPQKTKHSSAGPTQTTHIYPELLLVESVMISGKAKNSWPMFSFDPLSTDSVFLTHDTGVSHIDFSSWTKKMGAELADYTNSGIRLRTNLILQEAKAIVEHPIRVHNLSKSRDEHITHEIPACVALTDSDLGFFVLTSVDSEPRAVTLEESIAPDEVMDDDANEEFVGEEYLIPTHEPRPPYQPSKDFWNESRIMAYVGRQDVNRNSRMMKDEIRFSPAILKYLVDIHRRLSEETYRLGQAASELFVRCERLQEEFGQQIKEVNTAAERMEAVLGEEGDVYNEDDDTVGTANKIEQRIENVRQRQETLENRYASLRTKLGKMNGRPLNDKENLWVKEIWNMHDMVDKSDTNGSNGNGSEDGSMLPFERLEELKQVKAQLLDEVGGQEGPALGGSTAAHDGAPAVRSSVMHDINAMLERQTALIDATRIKVERLSTMST